MKNKQKRKVSGAFGGKSKNAPHSQKIQKLLDQVRAELLVHDRAKEETLDKLKELGIDLTIDG